jgi:glycosyltransferase involved in cell wall biosynthesis
MRIACLLAYDSGPFAGVVRPFINWAKQLREHGNHQVDFLLIGVGNKIVQTLAKSDFRYYNSVDPIGLPRFCKEKDYEVIVTDDYIERLKILDKIPSTFRKAVYAQVLYGIHSISPVHNPHLLKEKLMFSAARFVPFWLIRQRYVKLLKRTEILIANSKSTANLLRLLYGLEPNGVIYPPVDGSLFRPYPQNGITKEVVLYCGSNAGDTNIGLLRRIVEFLVQSDCIERINLFGNRMICENLNNLAHGAKIRILHDLEDSDLAKTYSRSILTVTPQEWETFGYTPMESMLCGTPVLAYASQPFSELVEGDEVAYLVYNRKAFIEGIERLFRNTDLLHSMKQRCLQHRENLLNNMSCELSADKLLSLLT